MDNPQHPSNPPSGSASKLPLAISFVAGAALMALLYGTGVMAGLSSAAKKATGASEIVSLEQSRYDELQKIRGIVHEVAAEKKKPEWQVTVQELQANAKIKDMKLDDVQSSMTLQSAIASPTQDMPEPKSLEGYKPVDFSDKKSKVYNYAVLKQPPFSPGQTQAPGQSVVPFGEEYGGKAFFVYRLEITRKPTKGPDGKDLPPTPAQTVYFGPVEEKELDQQIEQVKTQVNVKKLPVEGVGKTSVPVRFYANDEGKLAMVIEGAVPNPHRIVNRGPITYYRIPAAELEPYMKEREKDPAKPLPPSEQAVIAVKK